MGRKKPNVPRAGVKRHQSIIKGCDEILQQLNPEIIEKQRQEQENKALREEINSLKEMFKEFIIFYEKGREIPRASIQRIH